MSTAQQARPRRSSADRVLTGVAGGLGERLGIDPLVIRLAFVDPRARRRRRRRAVPRVVPRHGVAGPARRARPAPRTTARGALAVALVVGGLLVISRRAGLWFGDEIVWPAALAVAGSAVLWTRGDGAHRAKWLRRLPHADLIDGSRVRALVGVGLILLGAWALLSNNLTLFANAPLAVVAVLGGVAVVAGPWVWRLGRQVALERRERIRQEERAEMAAHLHDSVLQTLALIQRTDDPGEMVALARGQERALRTWLYGKMRPGGAGSLSAALDDVAAEVERTHRTRIEVVIVGDCPVDDGVRALVHACREAMVNAARHSGARGVSRLRRGRGRRGDGVRAGPGHRVRARERSGRSPRHRRVDRGPDGAQRRPRADRERARPRHRGPAADPESAGVIRVFLVEDHELFASGVRTELGKGSSSSDMPGPWRTRSRACSRPNRTSCFSTCTCPTATGRAWSSGARTCGSSRCQRLGRGRGRHRRDPRRRPRLRHEVDLAAELADAIRRVHEGDAVFSPRLAGFVLDAFAGSAPPSIDPELDQLTAANARCSGTSPGGTRTRRSRGSSIISVKTVETHVSAVLRKLRLSNRYQVARWAVDRRVV